MRRFCLRECCGFCLCVVMELELFVVVCGHVFVAVGVVGGLASVVVVSVGMVGSAASGFGVVCGPVSGLPVGGCRF